MRPAVIGALSGGLVHVVCNSPLFLFLLFLGVLYQFGAVVVATVVTGPDMIDAVVYQYVHVTKIVTGPHRGRVARKGEMVTVALRNDSYYLRTKADNGNHETPLVMACTATSGLLRDGVLIGGRDRVVAMAMDWIVGDDGEPTFPVIRPGQTRTVDFTTKLDWDSAPLAAGEQLHDCVIGADKYQALLQKDVSVSDQNRASPYHQTMSTLTPAGRDLGYVAGGSAEPDVKPDRRSPLARARAPAANPYGPDIDVP